LGVFGFLAGVRFRGRLAHVEFVSAAQGVGGAIMFATSLALIAQAFEGKERGTAFGIYGAIIGGAVAIGLWSAGHNQWHRVALDLLPQRADRRASGRAHPAKVDQSRDPNSRRIDWLGFVSFSASLFMLVFALVRATTPVGAAARFSPC